MLAKISEASLESGAAAIDRELAQLVMINAQRGIEGHSLSSSHSEDVLRLARARGVPIKAPQGDSAEAVSVLWAGRMRVSLIVACYNFGHFLDEAIASVLAQTYRPDEIILSDDGSTDGSAEIMLAYAARYPGVFRLNLNEANRGIQHHFNQVVGLAEGEAIIVLGADNRLPAHYVECLLSTMEGQDDVGIVYTDFALFGGRAKLDYDRMLPEFRGGRVSQGVFLSAFPELNHESRLQLKQGHNFIHGSSMYRRAAFEAVGGYGSRDNGPEDMDFFQKILDVGYTALKNTEVYLEYRQHSAEQANYQFAYFGELERLREERNAWLAKLAEADIERSRMMAENRELSASLGEVRNSRSFRLGMAILAPARTLRSTIVKCRRIFAERSLIRGRMIRVIAIVSYKFDADLLADLQENLRGIADECIIRFDEHGELLLDEGRYRESMVREAEAAGADYVVSIDPDERFEKRTARKMQWLMRLHLGQRVLFEFNTRELYAPKKYRVDGIWGSKSRIMIFPIFADNIYSDAKLHSPHQPLNDGYRSVHTGLNLYHLKHIRPELRKNRRDTYVRLDPKLEFNPPGYDYLDDETGMRLKKIPLWRRYSPKYRKYSMDPGIFVLPEARDDASE